MYPREQRLKAIQIVALIGWIALCVLMYFMFKARYDHECEGVELAVKTMTKAFRKNRR